MWILKDMKLNLNRGYYEIKVISGDKEAFTRFNIEKTPLDQKDFNEILATRFLDHLNFITGITGGGFSGGSENEDQKPD